MLVLFNYFKLLEGQLFKSSRRLEDFVYPIVRQISILQIEAFVADNQIENVGNVLLIVCVIVYETKLAFNKRIHEFGYFEHKLFLRIIVRYNLFQGFLKLFQKQIALAMAFL